MNQDNISLEKVINGMECCTQHGSMCGLDCNGHYEYSEPDRKRIVLVGNYRELCSYGKCETGCVKTLARDALALLKAQEPEAMDAPKPDNDIGCWYDITHNYTLEQVVSALKEQEPRVMTLDEVKEAAEQEKPMYVHEAKFPESTRWLIPKNAGHYGFEERGSGCQFKYYDYLSKQIGGFCCWTSHPTYEQREAVKWG